MRRYSPASRARDTRMTAIETPRSLPRLAWAWALLVAAAVLGGCASGPRRGGDGPPAHPPPGLAGVPDAVPRIEPIRVGGPNKPYQALGREYVPLTADVPFHERGLASWYGRLFQGKRTSSGEPYDMYAMTAAHPTLPIPSYARIRNPANGRQIIVRINDRGPFHPGRIVDLSYAAALRLDLLRGVAPVELDRITFDDIRAGNWQRGDDANTRLAKAAEPTAPVSSTPVPIAPAAATTVTTAPVTAAPMTAGPVAAVPAAAAATAAVPSPVPTVDVARASRGFWVQLGAFREALGAQSFEQRVAAEVGDLATRLATFDETPFYRVQAGPYASRDEAESVASRLREALGLVPLIVERR